MELWTKNLTKALKLAALRIKKRTMAPRLRLANKYKKTMTHEGEKRYKT